MNVSDNLIISQANDMRYRGSQINNHPSNDAGNLYQKMINIT